MSCVVAIALMTGIACKRSEEAVPAPATTASASTIAPAAPSHSASVSHAASTAACGPLETGAVRKLAENRYEIDQPAAQAVSDWVHREHAQGWKGSPVVFDQRAGKPAALRVVDAKAAWGCGLVTDDRVESVNGVAITDRLGMWNLWRSLHGVKTLTVRVDRGGAPITVVYEIATR